MKDGVTGRFARVLGAFGVLGVAATLMVHAGGQSGSQAPSTFRAVTDLIPVDVSVLDEDRKPVRGLTASDFVVLEDGSPRQIVAFSAVEVPGAPPAAVADPSAVPAGLADWVRDAPHDVVASDLQSEGRLVVILLDRSIPAGRPVLEAQRIARATVDQLGPGDLAAVTRSSGFVNDGRVQGFTADRRLLLEAVNSPFRGWTPAPKAQAQAPSPVPGDDEDVTDCQCGLCVLESIGSVAKALSDAPRRRKVILFVGSVVRINPPRVDDPCYAAFTDARGTVLQDIDMANVTFHAIDPAGAITTSLTAEYIVHAGDTPQQRMALQRHYNEANLERLDNLRVLPERTGGRLVANTNAPAEAVPAIFEESQSYYLLGFEPGAPADGNIHRIDVRVNRPDVTVHTRSGYTAAPPAAAGGTAATLDGDIPELVAALHAAVPHQQLPLSASVAAFPGRAGQPVAVAVQLGASLPPGDGPRRLAIAVGAFDLDGQPVQVYRQSVEIPQPIDGSTEVREGLLTRLNLLPGRYEVRAAIKDERSGAIGSLFSFADVPDFDETPLALSGVVLRSSAPPRMPDNPFADVIPFVPTVARAFTRVEEPVAYVRVHQAVAPGRVSIRARVLDEAGQTGFEDAGELAADAFIAGDAEYSLSLPLADLEPGRYLLRIFAETGESRASKEVRFEVLP